MGSIGLDTVYQDLFDKGLAFVPHVWQNSEAKYKELLDGKFQLVEKMREMAVLLDAACDDGGRMEAEALEDAGGAVVGADAAIHDAGDHEDEVGDHDADAAEEDWLFLLEQELEQELEHAALEAAAGARSKPANSLLST